ncbi:Transcription elongation factor spt6, partial [Kickxella alabastrina]
MSDLDDFEGRRGRKAQSYSDSDEEGSDTFDTRRKHYSDDEESEDSEDDNDDELRRDGFLVDDDEVEENVSDGEERRQRRKKKKRRHIEHPDSDDLLDDEDLALVAENTNQRYESTSQAREKGSKFKRLKRGRGRQSGGDAEDEDLKAELDDLADNGSDNGGGFDEDDDVDDLGLFGNDDGRSGRRNERGGGGGRNEGRGRAARDMSDEDEDDDDDNNDDARGRAGGRRYDDVVDVPRRSRAEGSSKRPATAAVGAAGAVGRGEFFVDNIENIDEDTWMELQDIFGDGEEYAFAMDAHRQHEEDGYREKTLAEVFEPAELEAKLMTQSDEDIRTLDIPERIQMRLG